MASRKDHTPRMGSNGKQLLRTKVTAIRNGQAYQTTVYKLDVEEHLKGRSATQLRKDREDIRNRLISMEEYVIGVSFAVDQDPLNPENFDLQPMAPEQKDPNEPDPGFKPEPSEKKKRTKRLPQGGYLEIQEPQNKSTEALLEFFGADRNTPLEELRDHIKVKKMVWNGREHGPVGETQTKKVKQRIASAEKRLKRELGFNTDKRP